METIEGITFSTTPETSDEPAVTCVTLSPVAAIETFASSFFSVSLSSAVLILLVSVSFVSACTAASLFRAASLFPRYTPPPAEPPIRSAAASIKRNIPDFFFLTGGFSFPVPVFNPLLTADE